MSASVKPIEFLGRALSDLCRFPDAARREAGYQLYQVQEGEDPDDWKPMNTIGQGVREIRIRERWGIPRNLCGQVRRRGLCPALFSEEDAKDKR